MQNKMNVGIILGGKSAEHEVSLLSAQNIISSVDTQKYTPVLIGVDKKGTWFLLDRSAYLLNPSDPKRIALNTELGRRIVLVPGGGGVIMFLDTCQSDIRVDVVFPIIHGPFGEDGSLQGILKSACIPFVGAGVAGSAIGMDKDVMKRLLRDAGIPIGKFLAMSGKNTLSFQECAERLGLPLFIKPANMGSSVGVSKVFNKEDFDRAVKEAFTYDAKILIEEYIKGREIECSVLGDDDASASVPGEIISSHEFYSYDAKYLDENGARAEIPAQLSDDTTRRIQELATQTFKVLLCEGFGRVDFFLTENGDIFVNEINTIPGFTSISLYPKLWEASGISCTELVNRLIQLALHRFEKEKILIQEK
ncbi:MAG: D-alanine--D-alanine ligase [Candidatus Uhrbacteria bacterium]|nr:D-alanine--D-alanine ligase [Candidatus Uhrbacteria bacterium]